MTENSKTLSLVIGALIVLGLAWVAIPKPQSDEPPDDVGQPLFADWKDPFAAKNLKITSFDEKLGAPRSFEVFEVNGSWTLPSHSKYPADAKDQVAAAASSLIDLKIVDVVTDEPGSHELYGVIEPDKEKISQGMVGVGKLVAVQDGSGNNLARLVIGKEATPRTEGGFHQPAASELRYVRRAGQNRVYLVAMKTDKLSTKFSDWIETDLLKLSTWDVKEIVLKDYSVDVDNPEGVALNRKSTIALNYNDTDAKWNLGELTEFENGEPVARTLAEDEELNSQKLGDLKNALGDLKIVNVSRKPEKLSASLKEGQELPKDSEGFRSLADRGFYALKAGQDQPAEIFSNDGEVVCRVKDGVEYLLRFGQFVVVDGDESNPPKDGDSTAPKDSVAKKADAKDDKGPGVGRFILVTCQFNPDLIPPPKLDPLPGEKPAEAPAAAKPGTETAPPEKSDAAAPATEPPESNADEPAPESKGTTESGKQTQSADSAADEKATDPKKSESKKADTKKTDSKKTDAKPTDADDAADKEAEPAPPDSKPAVEPPPPGDADAAKAKPPADPEAAEREKEAQDAERKRIEKENQRKQDEHDEKIKKGKARVRELNARFADWYFIVSDDVYKKIHLSRADIIKKKPAKDDKDAAGADKAKPADLPFNPFGNKGGAE